MLERIGVTGTPGSGKKTIAPLLAARLGLRVFDLNALAIGRRTRQRGETMAVDVESLRDRLKARFRQGVIYGHLLPNVFRGGDLGFVAVLRCDPSVLKRRLLAREYSLGKLRENLEAELIGVILDECVRRFGAAKVHEYDTSRESPARIVSRILSDMTSSGRRKSSWIDWTLVYGSPRRLESLLSTERTDSALT